MQGGEELGHQCAPSPLSCVWEQVAADHRAPLNLEVALECEGSPRTLQSGWVLRTMPQRGAGWAVL